MGHIRFILRSTIVTITTDSDGPPRNTPRNVTAPNVMTPNTGAALPPGSVLPTQRNTARAAIAPSPMKIVLVQKPPLIPHCSPARSALAPPEPVPIASRREAGRTAPAMNRKHRLLLRTGACRCLFSARR
jgi:hypothetical protein